MTIYAILSDHSNDNLKARVEEKFPTRYEISKGQQLVSAEGMTTEQVAEAIGKEGEHGRFIVMPVTTYWGWHNQNLWEWLKLNPPR